MAGENAAKTPRWGRKRPGGGRARSVPASEGGGRAKGPNPYIIVFAIAHSPFHNYCCPLLFHTGHAPQDTSGCCATGHEGLLRRRTRRLCRAAAYTEFQINFPRRALLSVPIKDLLVFLIRAPDKKLIKTISKFAPNI